MRSFLFTISIALSCITNCMATWEEVYGSVSSMHTQGTGSFTTWYRKVSLGEEFSNDISFSSLLEVANAHWNYVKTQPNAFTKKGTCLVAAVYVPGGNVILSTIPRGNARRATDFLGEMMLGGATNTPKWWAQKTGKKLDAEDAAVYLTEVDGYIGKSGLKVAVYGTHEGSGDTTGGPVNPCRDCASMLGKLNIPYFTSSAINDGDADQYESEQLFKRSPAKQTSSKKVASTSKAATTSSKAATTSSKAAPTSSTKIASSASASAPAQTSSAAVASSTASTKPVSSSSTKTAASASASSAALVSSSTSSGQASATSGSAATTSGATTSVKPVKLTAEPFTMSLTDQPEFDMSGVAATTTGGTKATSSTSSAGKTTSPATSSGAAAQVTSAASASPTTMQTSTVKKATTSK